MKPSSVMLLQPSSVMLLQLLVVSQPECHYHTPCNCSKQLQPQCAERMHKPKHTVHNI